MRACVFDPKSSSGVKLIERKKPHASGGIAIVKVAACGANPVDAKYIIGDKLPETWMGWAAKRAAGHTPGFDFSGTIVEVSESSGFKVGDAVYGFACNPAQFAVKRLIGSFSEYVAAPLDQLAKKPEKLSHIEAAGLPLVGTTALQAFIQHKVREGQRVLVIGASGGVGHIAVQVACHLGAHVTAICSSRNTAFVKDDCGAGAVLSYDDGDVFAKISEDAKANGKYDFVLDCVSSADSRDAAASYMAKIEAMEPPVVKRRASDGKGTDGHNYVVLGGATSDWGKALLKRFFALNCFASGRELFWIKMPGSRGVLERLAAFADASADAAGPKPLKPKIDVQLPFSEESARKAFDTLRGRRTAGKIVMVMSGTEEGSV